MQYYKVVRVNPKTGKLVSSYASARCKKIKYWRDHDFVSYPLLVYTPGQVTRAYKGSPGVFLCWSHLDARIIDVYRGGKYRNCEVRLYPVEVIGDVATHRVYPVCPAVKLALEPVKTIKFRNGILEK